MPRKGEVKKREILPDPKYGDKLVAKFVNTIMGEGKKSVAEKILYRSLDIVAAKGGKIDGGETRRGIDRCGKQSRRGDKKEGRYPSDGRGKQGLCSLSLVGQFEDAIGIKEAVEPPPFFPVMRINGKDSLFR